ncbi:MAG: hypothetical protein HQL91_12130 [Magnetococcales bacterium]|nr:hypothetical protein [Magnetococcales bacterium]
MSEQIYYKVLGPEGLCCHGGVGQWKLDGSWMLPVYGRLAPCVRGYHLCRAEDLVEWIGPVIWTAEGRGLSFLSPQYHIFQEARVIQCLDRWTPAMARGFAVVCAERVLPMIAAVLPGDRRVTDALELAREWIGDAGRQDAAQSMAAEIWRIARLFDDAARDALLAIYGTVCWQSGGMAAWAAAASVRSAVAAAAREGSLVASKAQGVHPRDAERQADGAANEAWKSERAWQTDLLFSLIGDEA